MQRRQYTYAGLRIRSELPIPEWAIFEEKKPFDDPEVVVSLAPAAVLQETGSSTLMDDEYRFFVPGVGEYRVRAGREIIVTPVPGAGKREIRLFLLGSAWGVLCYQRGLLVLHCSAVRAERGALIFCGPAGSGKSTAAAWLTGKGFRFASDDLCRFETSAGAQPRIYPSVPRLKLWREALRQLGRSDEGLERDHFRREKYHLPLTGMEGRDPLPLLGIFLLEWGDTRLTRLRGMTALSRFVAAATYRGELLEPMDKIAAHWERCAALMKRVPVWEFMRPKEWPALEAAMNLLLTHLKNLTEPVIL